MSYHPSRIRLSLKQLNSLKKGSTVRVKHEDLGGGDEVHLTPEQHQCLDNAHLQGKGATLAFTQHQCHYHCLKGAGRVGDYFRRVKDKLLGYASDATPAVVGALVGAISRPIEQYVPGVVQPYYHMGVEMGKKYSTEQLQHLLQGLRTVDEQRGGGLFAPGNH